MDTHTQYKLMFLMNMDANIFNMYFHPELKKKTFQRLYTSITSFHRETQGCSSYADQLNVMKTIRAKNKNHLKG